MDVSKEEAIGVGDGLDADWSSAETNDSAALTEIEWTLLRFASAFERCVLQLASLAGEQHLSLQEVLFLYLMSLQKQPQTSTSLAHQLNREDIINVQYTLRKLGTRGLVAKTREPRSKIYTFTLTEQGGELMQRYSAIKRVLLLDKVDAKAECEKRLEATRQLINGLARAYDEVARESPTSNSP